MSQFFMRRASCALLYVILSALTTACTSLQRTELTPLSATAAASGKVADTAPMSEVRVLMRDGQVMTLQNARLALRDDTLHAVVRNNDAGAPAKTVSVPMTDVAEVETPRRSWDSSLGLVLGILTVALIFIPS